MNQQSLRTLLQSLQDGNLNIDAAVGQLRHLQGESLPSAQLDHHRSLRTGIPEAVFGESKTASQLIEILTAQLRQPQPVLATRISKKKAKTVCSALSELTWHREAAMLTGNDQYIPQRNKDINTVIVTAGTSDLPVAEEARVTLKSLGWNNTTIYDSGIAGLHRILAHQQSLQNAKVIIVIAGMEGALPTVVAGMTPAPVIGIPTSVGYGTGKGGFSALLGMLNTCAPGLAVVNIDNGFGGACMASAILRNC
jgi:hypothetical protein